ncbi:hypothetical protein NDU88_001478 [Pleurodeles waltl]|uniref:Uncharacterized protein n=1 Tax=Pleurodeles waltl TaxID=8319 RepID=A0AAV7U6J2_PLEWA|nr:hypothetical protein NDU88_001478 [Pleurodeles waltl]
MQSHVSMVLERPHPHPRAAWLNHRQLLELRVVQRDKTCRARGAGRPSPGAQPAQVKRNPRSRRPPQAHSLRLGAGAASLPSESAPPLRQSTLAAVRRERVRGPRQSRCDAGRCFAPMGPASEPRPPRCTSAPPKTAAHSSLPKLRSRVRMKRCRRSGTGYLLRYKALNIMRRRRILLFVFPFLPAVPGMASGMTPFFFHKI